MTSNLLGMGTETVVREVFEDSPDVLLVVNPSEDVLEQLIDVGTDFDGELPTVRVLAEEGVLKTVTDDFIVASNAADLVESGVLSLRTATELPQNSLLVTESATVALVTAGDAVAGITADDGEFVDLAYDTYESDWEAAEAFTLRTPAISRVRESLTDSIGPEAEADFEEVLGSLETARGDGDGLDEVTISLLVAAKNNVLLYDISKWGEDVGIASKATFSRTKTRLEDLGLIDTEKVPIDVGRPRLRLKLADERLREASNADIASVAQSVLAS